MNYKEINNIINNKQKHDIFYNERPVWIQSIDSTNSTAKIGFIDNYEEKDVFIRDLYEKNLFN